LARTIPTSRRRLPRIPAVDKRIVFSSLLRAGEEVDRVVGAVPPQTLREVLERT